MQPCRLPPPPPVLKSADAGAWCAGATSRHSCPRQAPWPGLPCRSLMPTPHDLQHCLPGPSWLPMLLAPWPLLWGIWLRAAALWRLPTQAGSSGWRCAFCVALCQAAGSFVGPDLACSRNMQRTRLGAAVASRSPDTSALPRLCDGVLEMLLRLSIPVWATNNLHWCRAAGMHCLAAIWPCHCCHCGHEYASALSSSPEHCCCCRACTARPPTAWFWWDLMTFSHPTMQSRPWSCRCIPAILNGRHKCCTMGCPRCQHGPASKPLGICTIVPEGLLGVAGGSASGILGTAASLPWCSSSAVSCQLASMHLPEGVIGNYVP